MDLKYTRRTQDSLSGEQEGQGEQVSIVRCFKVLDVAARSHPQSTLPPIPCIQLISDKRLPPLNTYTAFHLYCLPSALPSPCRPSGQTHNHVVPLLNSPVTFPKRPNPWMVHKACGRQLAFMNTFLKTSLHSDNSLLRFPPSQGRMKNSLWESCESGHQGAG